MGTPTLGAEVQKRFMSLIWQSSAIMMTGFGAAWMLLANFEDRSSL